MSYSHLTQDERYVLNHLHLAGRSMTWIALQLKRSKSTISRELCRNATSRSGGSGPGAPGGGSGGSGGYWNHHADAAAKARRGASRTPYKLRSGPLLEEVRTRLSRRHSPDEIAGRLRLEHPDDPSMHISFEAIYLWAYRQGDPRWNQLLRKKHRINKTRAYNYDYNNKRNQQAWKQYRQSSRTIPATAPQKRCRCQICYIRRT